ncbi:hypothetical protein PENTCL1PPCAC_7691, partial [Pristionchus entomophagus]
PDPTAMHTVIVFVTLIASAAAQCTGNDHPNCNSWQRTGFCTNNGVEMVKKYCGVTCGLCTTDGFQTALGGGSNLAGCVDTNANCASWQAKNQFCTNPANSNAMKLQYCCKTCRPSVLGTKTTTAPPTTSTVTKCDNSKLKQECDAAKFPTTDAKDLTTPIKPTAGTNGGLKCEGAQKFVYYGADNKVSVGKELICEGNKLTVVAEDNSKKDLGTSTNVCCATKP